MFVFCIPWAVCPFLSVPSPLQVGWVLAESAEMLLGATPTGKRTVINQPPLSVCRTWWQEWPWKRARMSRQGTQEPWPQCLGRLGLTAALLSPPRLRLISLAGPSASCKRQRPKPFLALSFESCLAHRAPALAYVLGTDRHLLAHVLAHRREQQ